jgi:hypothetical protein
MKEHLRDKIFILLLTIAGALIRFYNLDNLSLSNDELSGIGRAMLPNLKELIWKGVHPDAHLVGTHFLLHLTIKLFGNDVFIIRLPFAIMGTLSIFLIYLIALKWFNQTVGLISATATCLLEFTVLYSQIARPYIYGFFFVLLFLYGLNYFIFSERLKWYHYAIFISGAIGAVLNHYFSFLTVVVAGFAAFALIRKEFYKQYIISGIIVLLLFLPHLPITLDQISRKGLDSWLEKPDAFFLVRFLFYSFNSSYLVVSILIILIIAVSFIKAVDKSIQEKIKKFRLFSIIVFTSIFCVGYFYSLFVNPVIQYSVLIFVLPFLWMFIFSFFYKLPQSFKWPIVTILVVTFSLSTFAEKKYYQTNHFGVFKEIAVQTLLFNKLIGENSITQTINVVNPFYINFYFNKMNADVKFLEYSFLNDGSGYQKMDSILKSAKTNFFIHAWSNVFDPYEIHELIKNKYPKYYEKKYFNSNFRVYYKAPKIKKNAIFYSQNTFDVNDKYWSGNESCIQFDLINKSNKVCVVDRNNPYSPNFRAKVKDVFKENKKHIIIKARYYLEENSSLNLVIDFLRNNKSYEWYGPTINNFMKERNEWKEIIIVKKLPKQAKPDDDILIYFWNTGNVPVKIDDVSIAIYDDTDYSW